MGKAGAHPPALARRPGAARCCPLARVAPTLPQTRTETWPLDLNPSWAPLAGIPESDFFPPNFTSTVLRPSMPPAAEMLRLKQRFHKH